MDECAYECGLGRSEHRPGLVAHPFTPRGAQRAPEASLQVSTMPSDAVLRQVLIDKGVLTTRDLARAESKIRSLQDLVGE